MFLFSDYMCLVSRYLEYREKPPVMSKDERGGQGANLSLDLKRHFANENDQQRGGVLYRFMIPSMFELLLLLFFDVGSTG